jgi:polysaccharide biosynthesis/export protein
MSHRAAGWALAGATLAMSVLVGGCSSISSGSLLARHDSPPADKAKAPFVLAQGMAVDWKIKPAKADPSLILSGHSIVGPDGKIEMGPYGPCAVAGLTLPKATIALQKHLSRYITGPTVTVTTPPPPPTAAVGDIAWRPSGTAPDGAGKAFAVVGFQQAKDGVPPADADKEKEKEKPKEKVLETIPSPRTMLAPGAAAANCPPNYHGILPNGPLAAVPSEVNPIQLPSYVIGPSDVLQIESLKGLEQQAIRGPHLVGPDGSVRVGIHGAVPVAGLTLDDARLRIAETIKARSTLPLKTVLDNLSVDVLAYNSKQFFIITDGGGQGEQVVALPITGNDTVLNAMAKINGLSAVSSKYRVWVARVNGPGSEETILPVDWVGVTQRAAAGSNWQLMPGDRIYVHSDPWVTASVRLSRVLQPFERVLGVMLLGSQTVNSIRSGSVGGTR